MNILVVSSYLPYPLFSGGHIRLYNLIKHLSKNHTITLVCEKREYQKENDIKEIGKYCKAVLTVNRGKQWSAKNVLHTAFSTNAFLTTGHTHATMKTTLNALLEKERFDIIHAETFYIFQNIPSTTIPIVLVEHNIEYLVYKRYADNAPLLIRPLLYIDVLKLKRQEEKIWEKVRKLVAVSEEEKRYMKQDDVSVVPNGVDTSVFSFKLPEKKIYHSVAKQVTLPEKEILFIGDFKWIQNQDSARWIINDIWPFLLRAVEGEAKIKLWIVGRKIPESIKKLNKYDSITFDENASRETKDIFRKADVLLTPIKVGGGTSYKILEAMASGVPVVTTTIGIMGLEGEIDKHAVVGDDTQTIVEKTARLLRDDEFYNTLAKNARKLVEEKYDWKIIAEKLEKVYRDIKRNSS